MLNLILLFSFTILLILQHRLKLQSYLVSSSILISINLNRPMMEIFWLLKICIVIYELLCNILSIILHAILLPSLLFILKFPYYDIIIIFFKWNNLNYIILHPVNYLWTDYYCNYSIQVSTIGKIFIIQQLSQHLIV